MPWSGAWAKMSRQLGESPCNTADDCASETTGVDDDDDDDHGDCNEDRDDWNLSLWLGLQCGDSGG